MKLESGASNLGNGSQNVDIQSQGKIILEQAKESSATDRDALTVSNSDNMVTFKAGDPNGVISPSAQQEDGRSHESIITASNINVEIEEQKNIEKIKESSGNFQKYLFENNQMNIEHIITNINNRNTSKKQSFEQLAGQSVSDISPSQLPEISAVGSPVDGIDGMKDYQIPQNREPRGIFSLLNDGKLKNNAQEEDYTEEQADHDEEMMQEQKFTHGQNTDLSGLVDFEEAAQQSEDMKDMTGDMTYECHQLKSKQIFTGDAVTAPNQLSQYDNELIDQHQYDDENMAAAKKGGVQSNPYNSQQSRNEEHQFSFKDTEGILNSTNRDENGERIKIDNLISEVQAEQYIPKTEDHQFQFKNQDDSPSRDSNQDNVTHSNSKIHQLQNNQRSLSNENKSYQHPQENENFAGATQQTMGGVVSINVKYPQNNNDDIQEHINIPQNRYFQEVQQFNLLEQVSEDQEQHATNTPLSQKSMEASNQNNAESSIHQTAQHQIDFMNGEQGVAEAEADEDNQMLSVSQRVPNRTQNDQYSRQYGNQQEMQLSRRSSTNIRRRSNYHRGPVMDPDDYEGIGEDYGEDGEGPHKFKNEESERENTEIDFIQIVDTDRTIANTNNDDSNLYLPVNSDNQIQIQSKQQIDINHEIQNKKEPESATKQPSQQNSLRAGSNSNKKQIQIQNKRLPNISHGSQGMHQHHGMFSVQSIMQSKYGSSTKNGLPENDQQNEKSLLKNKKKEAEQTSYTEIFVWGNDQHGQLGLELQNSLQKSQAQDFYKVPKSCSFNVIIKQISCGSSHSAMLTMSGYLYMMGSNQFGQLGIGFNQSEENKSNSRQDFQSTFRNQDGEFKQQWGDPQRYQCMRAPCLVDMLKKVRIQRVDCGSNYTIVLAQGGQQVYAWGCNSYGQLGIGQSQKQVSIRIEGENRQNQSFSDKIQESTNGNVNLKQCVDKPIMIQNFPFAKEILVEISCGENHTLFKTYVSSVIASQKQNFSPRNACNHVYACGLNSDIQCGIQKNYRQLNKPTKLNMPKSLSNIAQIKAFENQSLFLCGRTGFVYKCGGGAFYQNQGDKKLFSQIVLQDPIKKIDSSAIGSVALSFSGNIYIWGTDNSKPCLVPQEELGGPIKEISMGKNFVILLSDSHKDYSLLWGNLTQNLNIPSISDLVGCTGTKIKKLKTKNIKTVKCGDNFVFALGRDIQSGTKSTKERKKSQVKKREKKEDNQLLEKIDGIAAPTILQPQNQVSDMDQQPQQYPDMPMNQNMNGVDPSQYQPIQDPSQAQLVQQYAMQNPQYLMNQLQVQQPMTQYPQESVGLDPAQQEQYLQLAAAQRQQQEYLQPHNGQPAQFLNPQQNPQSQQQNDGDFYFPQQPITYMNSPHTQFDPANMHPHNLQALQSYMYQNQQLLAGQMPFQHHTFQLMQNNQQMMPPGAQPSSAGASGPSQGGKTLKKEKSKQQIQQNSKGSIKSNSKVSGSIFKSLSTARSIGGPGAQNQAGQRLGSSKNESLAKRKAKNQHALSGAGIVANAGGGSTATLYHQSKGVMACQKVNFKGDRSRSGNNTGLPPSKSLNVIERGYVDLQNHNNVYTQDTKKMNFENKQINGILKKQVQNRNSKFTLTSEPEMVNDTNMHSKNKSRNSNSQVGSKQGKKPAKSQRSTASTHFTLPQKKLVQGKRSQSLQKNRSRKQNKPKAIIYKSYQAQNNLVNSNSNKGVTGLEKSFISSKSRKTLQSGCSRNSRSLSDQNINSKSAKSGRTIGSNQSSKMRQITNQPTHNQTPVATSYGHIQDVQSTGKSPKKIRSTIDLHKHEDNSAVSIATSKSRISQKSQPQIIHQHQQLIVKTQNQRLQQNIQNLRKAEMKLEKAMIPGMKSHDKYSNQMKPDVKSATPQSHIQLVPLTAVSTQTITKSHQPSISKSNQQPSRQSSDGNSSAQQQANENVNQSNQLINVHFMGQGAGGSQPFLASDDKMQNIQADGDHRIKALKLKLKNQKNEIKLLIDDNIQKDNQMQRLVKQVERYKRGFPSKSRDGSGSAKAVSHKGGSQFGDTVGNIFNGTKQEEQIEKQKLQIQKLKVKLKKQNVSIKSLNQKLVGFNGGRSGSRRNSRARGSSPALANGNTKSVDLFLATEKNCNMEERLQAMEALIKKQDELLQDKSKEMKSLIKQHKAQEQKIASKDRQLLEATSELDQLQNGIRDFQDQTHQIQNELILKIQNMQVRLEEQMAMNDELRYEIERTKEHKQSNFIDYQKMNNLITENVKKNKEILELQQDTKRMENKMKSMQKIVDKSHYNDLVKGLARQAQSDREDPPNDYFSNKDTIPQEKTGRNHPTNAKSRLKAGSHEFSNQRLNPNSQEFAIQSPQSQREGRSPSKQSRKSFLSNRSKVVIRESQELINSALRLKGDVSQRSIEKYNPKAHLKDMISDRLKSQQRELSEKSYGRRTFSYEKYGNEANNKDYEYDPHRMNKSLDNTILSNGNNTMNSYQNGGFSPLHQDQPSFNIQRVIPKNDRNNNPHINRQLQAQSFHQVLPPHQALEPEVRQSNGNMHHDCNYYKRVDSHQNHTYLGRMGEANRAARQNLDLQSAIYSPQKQYFNQQDGKKGSVPSIGNNSQHNIKSSDRSDRVSDRSFGARGEAEHDRHHQNQYRRGNEHIDIRQKEQSIQELKDRYNQLMRQSLERKATKKQADMQRIGAESDRNQD